MSGMEERFAVAGAPRNLWSEGRADEQSLLGALGMADALGAALWRLKYKGDSVVALRAIVLMADRLAANGRWKRSSRSRGPGARGTEKRGARPGDEPDLLQRLSARVILEWVNDRCAECHGRGTVGRLGHVRTCTRCKGVGREPVQHADRASALGLGLDVYRMHWEWRMGRLLTELEGLDAATRGAVARELKIVHGEALNLDPAAITIASNAEQSKSAA